MYDFGANRWLGVCPHGDLCTHCDAVGYCARMVERERIVAAYEEARTRPFFPRNSAERTILKRYRDLAEFGA